MVWDINAVNSDINTVKVGHYFVNRRDVRPRDSPWVKRWSRGEIIEKHAMEVQNLHVLGWFVVWDINAVNSDINTVKLGHYFVNRRDVRPRDSGGQKSIAIFCPGQGAIRLVRCPADHPASELRSSDVRSGMKMAIGRLGDLRLIAKTKTKGCRTA